MSMIEGMLQELEMEAQTTRRVLERVPDAQLGWRPHAKARTLGELALHVATVPGAVAQLAMKPSPVPAPQFGADPAPARAADLVPALDRSIGDALNALRGVEDSTLAETWRITQDGRELFAVPRIAFLRSIMLNHWYHHRGQLTMYLRQLGVPLPSIYGPSADENPFT
jgi:uncharacterized damage-inducible protein DinB